MRKTSIIILSYNTYQYTKLCIESIRKYTAKETYEIIVIDNASIDESVSWLKKQTDIKCIFNKENVGFPKGCNQGMRLTDGTDILLLNSDTIVTINWLENMRRALYSQSMVGAVGCVTNCCSNGQAILVSYKSLEELHVFAEEYNVSDVKKWEKRTTLVGFCFLIKREAYQDVGEMDEQFTPGNYEDDDYSLRLLQHGYDLILCKDTFIHHFGSKSFIQSVNQTETETRVNKYNRLLKKNEILFFRKWNVPKNYKIVGTDILKNILTRDTDENKICFITCVNDENKYKQCIDAIKKLKIPKGMSIESIAVYHAASMSAGYEEARLKTNAKYKIYLHQDVELIYTNLLNRLIESFKRNPEYGMLGVVGAKELPANAIWWESNALVGAIYDNHTSEMDVYKYQGNEKKISEVVALDGVFLATQYDVAWRMDIFNHFDFYDISQCMEFRRNGYKVGVLPQRMPWCVHYCGINQLKHYNEERVKFIEEYRNEI